MNKKTQKQGKQANNLNKFLGRKQKKEERSTSKQKPKNEGKKKVLSNNNNLTNNPNKTQPPPPSRKIVSLQLHLKQLQTSEILEKCPKLLQLVRLLSVKSGLEEDLISNLTKKCLESSASSLWSYSYAPAEISQLFNVQAANHIKQWLNAFFEYKNKMIEEDSSFNYIRHEKKDVNYNNIRDNSWDLLALIIRGRPGVGKTSAVKAVVKEMDVHIQQCGNDYHQSKYLKQKFESTQSESVKGVCIKKVKVDTKAQMITKFMPTIEKERPKENKKAQIIHNVSKIYPESDVQKFYTQLSRCVSLSKIPFILTNSLEKIPKECQKYDIIQFESGSSDKIHKVLWTICHLQSLLILQKGILLEKEAAFQELNSQLSSLEFKQLCSEQRIKQICELYSYRLDYILAFLQNHRESLRSINLSQFFVKKFKQINEDQLLEQIQFIDFSKATPLSSQVHSSEKFQDNTQESTQIDKTREQRQMNLTQYTKKLSLLTAQDTVKEYQQLPHSKYKWESEEWDTHPHLCIKNQVHQGIKASLSKMINKQIGYSYDKLKSTVRPSQLCYLPMLIRQKRANRSSRVSVDALKKVYDDNQFCYLEHFGHFIKSQ